MPGRKLVLHEAWREASKVVRRRWRLVERRWLLVGRERPTEVWRTLHAEWRLPLTPRWRLVRLVAPRRLVELAAPGGRGLVLAAPGASGPAVPRAAPVGIPLLVPHTLVAVPRWAGGRDLSGVEWRLEAETLHILMLMDGWYDNISRRKKWLLLEILLYSLKISYFKEFLSLTGCCGFHDGMLCCDSNQPGLEEGMSGDAEGFESEGRF